MNGIMAELTMSIFANGWKVYFISKTAEQRTPTRCLGALICSEMIYAAAYRTANGLAVIIPQRSAAGEAICI